VKFVLVKVAKVSAPMTTAPPAADAMQLSKLQLFAVSLTPLPNTRTAPPPPSVYPFRIAKPWSANEAESPTEKKFRGTPKGLPSRGFRSRTTPAVQPSMLSPIKLSCLPFLFFFVAAQ
jgi:hypothetical protein